MFFRIFSLQSKSFGQLVSRVLYLAIIYLDVLSPARSSDLPLGRRRAAALTALSWSCSGWGLHGNYVTITPGELLPHHFTLTTALSVSAVCFCCTFPIVTYARRYLASSPCGARTFLIHPEDARDCLNYPKPCAFQQSFSIISSQRGQCPLPIG